MARPCTTCNINILPPPPQKKKKKKKWPPFANDILKFIFIFALDLSYFNLNFTKPYPQGILEQYTSIVSNKGDKPMTWYNDGLLYWRICHSASMS